MVDDAIRGVPDVLCPTDRDSRSDRDSSAGVVKDGNERGDDNRSALNGIPMSGNTPELLLVTASGAGMRS